MLSRFSIVTLYSLAVTVTGIKWTKPESDDPLMIEAGEDLMLEWEFRDELPSHIVMIYNKYFVVGVWNQHYGLFTKMKSNADGVEFRRLPIPGPGGKSVGEKIGLKMPKIKRNDMLDYTCEVTLKNGRMYHKIQKVEWKGLANATKMYRELHPVAPTTTKPGTVNDRKRVAVSIDGVSPFHITSLGLVIAAGCVVVVSVFACWMIRKRRRNGFKKVGEKTPDSVYIDNQTPIYRKNSDSAKLLMAQ